MMNKRFILTIALAIVFTAAWGAAKDSAPSPRNTDGKPFVHPGIFYTQGDFDRMKAMVAAGKEPWKRTFEALRGNRFSNAGVWSRPRGGEIGPGQFNSTIGFDGRYAHDIALMWKLTGDEAYAMKARDFLVNNSNWTGTSWAGTGPLDNGKIFLLIEAAEMMRDYPGWKKEDQAKFGEMLRKVFYPHIMTGDIMRWGNQGLMAWHGQLAMAIFLDDRKMYDRVWNYITGLPHRPDDVPYCSGGAWRPAWPANYGEFNIERTKPSAIGQEPDWGYDDQLQYYIYPNGQSEEICRDQAHATFGLFQMVSLAEIFWNQGDDLYSMLDNRILKGIEWILRYNKSDWEPKGYTDKIEEATFENGFFYRANTRNARWTALKPSPAGRGSDGGPAAPRTAALVHYAVRQGVEKREMPWLLKTVASSLKDGGYESWGFGANWYYEYEGWGTLTKYRTAYQHGDPGSWKDGVRISGAHFVPCAIKAADCDFLPGCETPVKTVSGKRCLTAKKRGETFDYTLSVAESAEYVIEIVYRSPGSFAFTLTADGGRPLSRKLPRADKFVKSTLGRMTLEAGAPVLKLRIDSDSFAAVYAIALRRP